MARKKPLRIKLQDARAPAIKWVEQDIDLMVQWFCSRNKKGVAVNYKVWATSTHTDVAERILKDTGLVDKPLVTKKKAADKMDAMVKDYKDMRMKAEGSGWGTDAGTHKTHDLNSPHGTTVGDFILKKCPWFYDFEGVYNDHPGVNPPVVIESGQPPRRNGQAVEETDLGGLNDKDAEGDTDKEASEGHEESTIEKEKEIDKAEDSDSGHSAHSLAAAALDRTKTAEKTIKKIILPPLSLLDIDIYDFLNELTPKLLS
ncbi:hypothetical protein HO173_006424 [Letharia columbiana]|uniref:Uncharacterized protein n=1 Tax=Letharia columbiana TaxID=112416 RepID=A0A8H6L4F4_9LECA|nr:uncharacterized protein HO173_006424 [Letharia columbiana]KAF6235230.1 hypothetical protein HO173_006424 [Letharia columbiana]